MASLDARGWLKVKNDRTLEQVLRLIGEEMGIGTQQRIVKTGLRSAAAMILKDAKKRAPRQKRKRGGPRIGGNLRKSLAVTKGRRIRRYGGAGRRGLLMAILGPSWPLGAHGHLVEKGTKRRKTKGEKSLPAGLKRGKMRRKPFLEPAYKAKVKPALREMRAKMWDGIEKAVKRHRAKMKV